MDVRVGPLKKAEPQRTDSFKWRANSLEKNPDTEKVWRQKEKGAEEDEMVG